MGMKRKHEISDLRDPKRKQKRIVKRHCYNLINGCKVVICDTRFKKSSTGASFFEKYKITNFIASGGNGVVCKGVCFVNGFHLK